jgi:hypothetical protein
MSNSDLYTTLDPEVYIDGVAYWASLRKPNTVSGKYEIEVALSSEEAEKVREMGVTVKTKTFDDSEEEYVRISSSSNAKYPIKVVFDEDDEDLTVETPVGNGSKVRVLCELAKTRFGKKEFFKLARPKVVRVKELVRYEAKANTGGLYA